MALLTNPQLLKEIPNSGWVRQSLFVPNRKVRIERSSAKGRFVFGSMFSYQTLNFSDTSLGGNRSINPKPQFTKFADPNLPSLLAATNNSGNPSATQSMGMGRYYSEAIDDNAQRIFLQFGVPAYNSLSNFFTTFYDRGHANMANSGTMADGLLFSIGKYAGFLIAWTIVPALSLAALFYSTGKKALFSILDVPLSKFYYMKPTMPLYWNTVTIISNALAVNMKLIQGATPEMLKRNSVSNGGTGASGNNVFIDPGSSGLTAGEISKLSGILPDIYLNDNGGIDVRAVANRYQRLSDAHERTFNEIREASLTTEALNANLTNFITGAYNVTNLGDTKKASQYTQDYIKSYSGQGTGLLDQMVDTGPSKTVPAEAGADASISNAISSVSEKVGNVNNDIANGAAKLWTGLAEHFKGYGSYLTAEARDGSAFVSFIVEYDATAGESFSNSAGQSAIASKMNETSKSSRSKLFDFANGNVGDGIVANTIETAISAATSVLSGVAEFAQFSGLAMLGGKAFVDIPDFWESSSVSLPTSSYTIKLQSPYGNPISIYSNIMVPLAMLLAGAAPRVAGRNAYTGPFLCKLWQRGRTQIQLGMIDALSISRGTGNVGWNLDGQPLGVDVTVSVVNLSRILSVPLATEMSGFDSLGITMFDEDTNFTDYMAVLGGLGLSEQYYATRRWRLKGNKDLANFNSFLSVNNFLSIGFNFGPQGKILSALSQGANLGGY